MHEHDLDLIAEYATGTLDDPSTAAELVASCSRCAEEYEAQRTVIAALAHLPAEPLSEFERARLHRNVFAAVGPEEKQGPTREKRAAGTWWSRYGLQVASAAAMLVVVVGVIGVGNRLQDGLEEDFATISSSLAGGDAEMAAAPTTALADAADSADLATPTGGFEPVVVDLGSVDTTILAAVVDEQRGSLRLYEQHSGDDAAGSVEPDSADLDQDRLEQLERCELPPEATVFILADLDGRTVVVSLSPDGGEAATWTDTCEPADVVG